MTLFPPDPVQQVREGRIWLQAAADSAKRELAVKVEKDADCPPSPDPRPSIPSLIGQIVKNSFKIVALWWDSHRPGDKKKYRGERGFRDRSKNWRTGSLLYTFWVIYRNAFLFALGIAAAVFVIGLISTYGPALVFGLASWLGIHPATLIVGGLLFLVPAVIALVCYGDG